MVRRGQRVARKVRPASEDGFAETARAWLSEFDVFVNPTLAREPVPVGTWRKGWVRTVLSIGNWVLTTPWNLAGCPAISLPFGTFDNGLPLGIQLVGPPGSDTTLLALAVQMERANPWAPIAAATR